MRKQTIDEKKKCPKCGWIDGQVKMDVIVQEHRLVSANTAKSRIL